MEKKKKSLMSIINYPGIINTPFNFTNRRAAIQWLGEFANPRRVDSTRGDLGHVEFLSTPRSRSELWLLERNSLFMNWKFGKNRKWAFGIKPNGHEFDHIVIYSVEHKITEAFPFHVDKLNKRGCVMVQIPQTFVDRMSQFLHQGNNKTFSRFVIQLHKGVLVDSINIVRGGKCMVEYERAYREQFASNVDPRTMNAAMDLVDMETAGTLAALHGGHRHGQEEKVRGAVEGLSHMHTIKGLTHLRQGRRW